jgi:enterochelin esterase-like enzyme
VAVAQASTNLNVEHAEFFSTALNRTMPYTIFLPPGYDSGEESYPTLYMLHGASGTNIEWENYGIFGQAQQMMLRGEIAPFIIVLPQGDQSYWVDHADGELWGLYTARDVVADVDARYRTITSSKSRAIGGLSMGADGALQLALNFPGTFGIVGADSPVLRPFDQAPAYFGDFEFFKAHSVPYLVVSKADVAETLTININVGQSDIWYANTLALDQQLQNLGIVHGFQVWSGEHNAAFWTDHVPDGLRFYSNSFR